MIRNFHMVGTTGFEPTTSCTPYKRTTKLCYVPIACSNTLPQFLPNGSLFSLSIPIIVWLNHGNIIDKGVYEMIKQRNIVICLILSLFTGGLYYFYWWWVTNNELNRAADVNDPGSLTVLILNVITLGLYGFYWSWRAGNKIDYLRDEPNGSTNILLLLLHIFSLGIITTCFIQNELNHLTYIEY